MSKTRRSASSGGARNRQHRSDAKSVPTTTMADVARAKRNLQRLMAEGYDGPDEDVFTGLCSVLLQRGVTGERGARVPQRLLGGVRPVIADEVQ